MAEPTFVKILLKDDRIACITPSVKYAVERGGQNVTSQPFKAISQRTSRLIIVSKLGTVTLYTWEEVLWEMALKGWEVTF